MLYHIIVAPDYEREALRIAEEAQAAQGPEGSAGARAGDWAERPEGRRRCAAAVGGHVRRGP